MTEPPAATDKSAATDIWPFVRSPALIADPIGQGLIALVLFTALFLIWPGLDLWFSGLFYSEQAGFSVAQLAAFRALRELSSNLLLIALGVMGAVVAIKLMLPETRSLIDPRHLLLAFSTLAAGPGLVVNLILKNNWGRPRPIMVEAFGGDMPFIGIWRITDHCDHNCSFVSGEASSAIWFLTLILFLPVAWRARALPIVLTLAVLLSLNRIAYGGHFLSDVLLSWAMTLTIIAAAHRLIYVHPPAFLAGDRLEQALTDAGQKMAARRRRWFRGSD